MKPAESTKREHRSPGPAKKSNRMDVIAPPPPRRPASSSRGFNQLVKAFTFHWEDVSGSDGSLKSESSESSSRLKARGSCREASKGPQSSAYQRYPPEICQRTGASALGH